MEIMGIKSIHEDGDTNYRQRMLMKGTLEDRVSVLEQIIAATVDKTTIPKGLRDKIKRVEDAEKAHPEKDD